MTRSLSTTTPPLRRAAAALGAHTLGGDFALDMARAAAAALLADDTIERQLGYHELTTGHDGAAYSCTCGQWKGSDSWWHHAHVASCVRAAILPTEQEATR